jgi:hypothetical protein
VPEGSVYADAPRSTRASDVVARYGNEEFVFALGETDMDGAKWWPIICASVLPISRCRTLPRRCSM